MTEEIYILKFTTGGELEVTKEEAVEIAKTSDNASITIKRLGIVIQKRMVQVFPKFLSDQMQDRKSQNTGVLHDGTRVRRHFGQWVISGNEVPDDKGNYNPVKLNHEYYPEIARDCVMSELEYEKIKQLPEAKRLEIFLSLSGGERRENAGGLTPLLG